MCRYTHSEAKRILMANRYLETFVADKNVLFYLQFTIIFLIILFSLPLAILIRLAAFFISTIYRNVVDPLRLHFEEKKSGGPCHSQSASSTTSTASSSLE